MANSNPDGPGEPGELKIPDEFTNSEGLLKRFMEFCRRVFRGDFRIKERLLEIIDRLTACFISKRDDPDNSNECNDEMAKMFESSDQEFDDSARMSQINECNDEMEKELQGCHKYLMNCAKDTVRITPNDTDEEKKTKIGFCPFIINFLKETCNNLRDSVRSCFESICGFFGYVARIVKDGIVYVAKKIGEGIVYVATTVKDGIVYVATKVKDGIVYVATKVGNGVIYVATKVKDGIVYVMTKVGDGFAYVATQMGVGFQYAATMVTEGFHYVVTKVTEGFQYVATTTRDLCVAVKNQISSACDYVRSLLNWS